MTKPMLGIAGVNTNPLMWASQAGVTGCLGIASVDRPAFHRASLGIAGNWGTTLREEEEQLLKQTKPPRSSKHEEPLGDRAAREGISRCVFLQDVFYTNCTNNAGEMVFRLGREEMFGPGRRRLPLYMDSGAFRRHQEMERIRAGKTGSKFPQWSFSYDKYVEAILLNQPEGFMSWDVIGDNQVSYQGYQRMMADPRLAGIIDRIIPVYQVGEIWDRRAPLLEPVPYSAGGDELRSVIANAQRIFQDPIFQHYLSRHRLIAIGGLVQHEDSKREARWVLFKELARLCPDHQFWGLGMASPMIINGLGPEGLLERIWVDGTWWILNATAQRTAVLQDGQIKVLFPKKLGWEDFDTTIERAAKDLRALAAAYSDCIRWPDPGPTVEEMIEDPEARIQMKKIGREAAREVAQVFNQTDLWHYLGEDFDQPGTEEG